MTSKQTLIQPILFFCIWLALNLIGLIGFFHLSKPLWFFPGDIEYIGEASDGILYHLILMPIVFLACLLNFLGLVAIIVLRKEPVFKQFLYCWLFIFFCWVLEISFFWYRAFWYRIHK
jgi:hypothetical protein